MAILVTGGGGDTRPEYFWRPCLGQLFWGPRVLLQARIPGRYEAIGKLAFSWFLVCQPQLHVERAQPRCSVTALRCRTLLTRRPGTAPCLERL